MDQEEILAVVFGVATYAIPAGGRGADYAGMKTQTPRHALGNLGMTVQARIDGRTSGQLVAGCAL